MFRYIVAFEHLLTPIAIEEYRTQKVHSSQTFKMLYVFGVRVAYWSTTKGE